jgi:hypothetical protein
MNKYELLRQRIEREDTITHALDTFLADNFCPEVTNQELVGLFALEFYRLEAIKQRKEEGISN